MHVRQVRDLKLATLDPTATCAVKALLELLPNCCLATKTTGANSDKSSEFSAAGA